MMNLIMGVVIGGALGVTLMCCLFMARDRAEQTEKEPTALLTVGSLIKYNGRVYEIERFTTDDDNQTIAHFGNEVWEYLIPVEELEAVME